MLKKSAALSFSVALALGGVVALLWLLGLPSVQAASYTVCPAGPPACNYSSIQAAVDAASDGDVIQVAAGTYTGVQMRAAPAGYPNPLVSGIITQVVYINKTVTIRGGYTTAFTDPPDPETNQTTLNAQGRGRVLFISRDISPTIEGLRITGGNAAGLGGSPWAGWDAGGGVYVISATATINNNRVFNNIASQGGGGLCLWYSAATLNGNTVISNNAVYDDGGGLYLVYSAATLNGNTVISNTANDDGGGLYLRFSAATLNGNTVISNTADSQGGGLFLWGSAAMLSGNTVISNTADSQGGGLSLAYSAATLTNTVIADNQANTAGSGLYIWQSSPRLLHTTIARNSGGDGSGVFVTSNSVVSLTNTILVGHNVGLTVTAGSTATLESTLWHGNTPDWGGAGVINRSHDYPGDPRFKADGYHLVAGSAAIDKGVDAGVTTDIDGETRPFGPVCDLGADEFTPTPALSVAKQADPDPAQAGAQLIYTIRVTNTGNVELHATVTDTLPAHLTPTGTRTWTPITITTPGGVWTQTVVVTVEMDYSGPLTNIVQVTTDEGAADTYTCTVHTAGNDVYLPVIMKNKSSP